jgi:hypothetical protein
LPRTTLFLEDDVVEAARAHARRHHLTLGAAVGDLVRRAADRPLVTEARNGFPVVRLPRHSPKVTSTAVRKLLEEVP